MAVSTELLALSGIGVPPYSVRGVTQSITPIPEASQLDRTINGESINLASSRFRKYTTTINCSDQQPPALDGVWPGTEVVVDCAVELAVQGTIEESTETETEQLLGRGYVPGSIRHENGFTFYRPRLTCHIESFNVNRDHWRAVVDWSLTLREI